MQNMMHGMLAVNRLTACGSHVRRPSGGDENGINHFRLGKIIRSKLLDDVFDGTLRCSKGLALWSILSLQNLWVRYRCIESGDLCVANQSIFSLHYIFPKTLIN